MKIPPLYTIDSEILELISKIEANKIFFSKLNLSSLIKDKIHRTSILKSSLFSARIEGNRLTLDKIGQEEGTREKIEIFNILKAINFIEKNKALRITQKFILDLHLTVMKNLSSNAGIFRKEPGAIFNEAGVAVYMSPPPSQIQKLINELLNYINSDLEKFPLINAFVSHLVFEKIHPFIDGNGRVGRLLIFSILKLKDNEYNFFIPLEEYLDEHKDEYYYYLDIGSKNPKDYLIFMLNSFYEESERVKELIEKETIKKEVILLPPRQEEILNIIKDHKIVSFDTIKRRFLKVPERTLRYELKKLLDKGFINKIGKTKSVYYSPKENT